MKKQIVTIIMLLISISAFSQDTIENIKLAFNAGSAKELIKYFNKETEVKIEDQGGNFTLAQAEPVIKEFFQLNPPKSFEYIHKGESPDGLKYNIGMYASKTKNYRVVMLLKKVRNEYVIDTITLTKS